jgi:hypothetical protein
VDKRVVGMPKRMSWIVGTWRPPVLPGTKYVLIGDFEFIEADFGNEYIHTGDERLEKWVNMLDVFRENFKDWIHGYMLEIGDQGEVLRILAITSEPFSKKLTLIDVNEWMKAHGLEPHFD